MNKNMSLESIFRLVHSLKRKMIEEIENLNFGIAPMHVRVMKIITKKYPCTSIDIAHYLDRDKAQVTRLINTLISKGLLIKTPNATDKRSHFLELTAEGNKMMNKVEEIDKQILGKLSQNIGEEELKAFNITAEKITSNLEKG